ncbi:hypothetical protein L479_02180 [Exiguobacterium sp. S17]|nr:hypothetical protein L479_02180 [Exiguobacterium sp. S17]
MGESETHVQFMIETVPVAERFFCRHNRRSNFRHNYVKS